MSNIFQQLQRAQEIHAAGPAQRFGVEIAVVTNVQDPDQLGRVKVKFPRLPGGPESTWARVAQPAAGAGRGFYWIPEVEDEVLVAFELGHANQPFVIGALWNGVDKPMQNAYNAQNTTRMIQTKSGHQIILEDKQGDEKIVIADMSGKRTLTFDVKNKKFVIDAAEGDVEIKAQKKIILQCEDLEVRTDKTAKLTIGTDFQVKADSNATVEASSKLQLKASRVDIN
jgi:uncharacterized protein involved in type VI secretion and phage assembly